MKLVVAENVTSTPEFRKEDSPRDGGVKRLR